MKKISFFKFKFVQFYLNTIGKNKINFDHETFKYDNNR